MTSPTMTEAPTVILPPASESSAQLPIIELPIQEQITRLEAEFNETQNGLDANKAVLKAAQEFKSVGSLDPDSPEGKIITQRQTNGETVDEIIDKSQANVSGIGLAVLDKELPFRKAQAEKPDTR